MSTRKHKQSMKISLDCSLPHFVLFGIHTVQQTANLFALRCVSTWASSVHTPYLRSVKLGYVDDVMTLYHRQLYCYAAALSPLPLELFIKESEINKPIFIVFLSHLLADCGEVGVIIIVANTITSQRQNYRVIGSVVGDEPTNMPTCSCARHEVTISQNSLGVEDHFVSMANT